MLTLTVEKAHDWDGPHPWELLEGGGAGKPRILPEENIPALAGVAHWTEHRPVNNRVSGLIPSQGTCLSCRPGPQ